MFWKMLKSDLKQKKGLSIVLFLFITVASVLVFVGGVQIYQFFTGTERNAKAKNSSDILVYSTVSVSDRETVRKKTDDILNDNIHVVRRYRRELLRVPLSNIDFQFIKESDFDELRYASHYLSTIPKEGELLYTMDDKPFSVENGTVWLSEKLRSITGAMEGDILKITSDIGNTYDLIIAGFYKQPFSGYNKWYVISEGDYEFLSKELLNKTDLYGIKLDHLDPGVFIELSDRLVKNTPSDPYMLDPESSDEYVLGFILSVFIALISLFLILIVIMTIRFTMIAAMKEEEREIGTLRAIGADSIKFRWLFAAKYIAFAAAGGVIGITAGIPLSKAVLTMFMPGDIMPSLGEMLLIGIGSVVLMVGLIIGFSLIVMRHINKIPIVDAIKGENRAERSGKGIMMHKRKKMHISFYIAFSDIIRRFKRYVFLFVAYTLGVLIILFVVNIKNSVITPDFLKYSMIYQTDFDLEFTNDQINSYVNRMVSEKIDIWDMVNEEMKQEGIAAHIDAEHYQSNGTMEIYGREVNASVWFGSGDISRLSYHEGNVPVQKDEIALSWSSANSLGIQLGDDVKIKMQVYPSYGNDAQDITGTFKVTAFINAMDGGVPIAVLSPNYPISSSGKTAMAFIIDSDNKEKVLAQMKEHFGDEVVLDGMEYTKRVLAEYNELFNLLEIVVGTAVLLILMLMTYLYTNIFIAEEASEIALMKSIGITESTIKLSHIFRILILSVVSVVLGEILLRTLGQVIVNMLMESLGITGFGFLPEFMMSFIVIPVIVIVCVLLTQWLNLKKIRKIDIYNIKDE